VYPGAKNILQKVEAVQQRFGLVSIAPQLNACRSLIARTDTIEVAVFGRYKSGKSSFLNALAGMQVLPVGVLPVTAVLTKLRYSSMESAGVTFMDGHYETIGIGEINRYITEEKNPGNEKRVTTVHVEVPGIADYQGLEFIDTPGTGSLFKHNTEVALNWLPYAAVALVVVSADQPLSEEDIGFIRQLCQHTPQVALILSKSDRVRDADLEKILKFSRSHLQNEFKADIPIYVFSSISPASDSRIAGWRKLLDEELLIPLRSNRAVQQTRILRHKFEHLIGECNGLLNVAMSAARRSADEREKIRQYVFEEGQSLPLVQKEIRLLVYDFRSTLIDRLWKHLEKFQKEVIGRITADFNTESVKWHGNLWTLTRKYEEWLHASLVREMKMLSYRERQQLLAPLKEAEAGLKRIAENALNRLTERVSKVLGISLPSPQHSLTLTQPEAPDVSVGRIFDTAWDSLWLFIPMILFRSVVKKHFMRRIRWEVEKHIARTASQWANRINKAIENASKAEDTYAQEQITTFQKMLSESDSRIPALEVALADLVQTRKALEEYFFHETTDEEEKIKT